MATLTWFTKPREAKAQLQRRRVPVSKRAAKRNQRAKKRIEKPAPAAPQPHHEGRVPSPSSRLLDRAWGREDEVGGVRTLPAPAGGGTRWQLLRARCSPECVHPTCPGDLGSGSQRGVGLGLCERSPPSTPEGPRSVLWPTAPRAAPLRVQGRAGSRSCRRRAVPAERALSIWSSAENDTVAGVGTVRRTACRSKSAPEVFLMEQGCPAGAPPLIFRAEFGEVARPGGKVLAPMEKRWVPGQSWSLRRPGKELKAMAQCVLALRLLFGQCARFLDRTKNKSQVPKKSCCF
ncbi:PREDICTED: uncharacterized protein LOC102030472 [Chinchilla lanigera]|uniref:uncharacterized protein LOC102030472 n=1 Tax=Chinchilla lanigera TaxID=34839 RepID=UPI000696CF14|nr:PREDICTED: uncharacterized protein LOC102030472 [Chinchilla lanigera]